MGVTDFPTKIAVVVREDLATWQRLNVTAFLMSGIIATGGEGTVGPDYEDAEREADLAIYTQELFSTGHDDDNRAAVKAVATDALDLVGLAIRAPHRQADQILRGLKRHP